MDQPLSAGPIRRVAYLGNHPPRECGIATFTADLVAAVTERFPSLDGFALAVNDHPEGYAYPPMVRYQIQADEVVSYRRAAEYVNASRVDVISLQHEYGIFGGPAGSHVLTLMRALTSPIVTTLHTVLRAPNPEQRAVMTEIVALSERLVVMSRRGAQFLQEVHGVDPARIDTIHHGIPPASSTDPEHEKARLRIAGKFVLMTFGLLSPDKGIENVIAALPEILARFPQVVYVVLGATHPQIRKHHGEAYRESLAAQAERLGVRDSVHFHDRFVPTEELTRFLRAADVYITPYLNPDQITSGTLAYALGSGKAVLSTPYYYAEELLAEGRGILVPWRDPAAIAREVLQLVAAPETCAALQRRAAAYGLEMVWPAVADRYLESFQRARREEGRHAASPTVATMSLAWSIDLPSLPLSHLQLMTDDTGILQHARFNVPNRSEGYCVDDNARGLLLLTQLEIQDGDDRAERRRLAVRYLSFLQHAFQTETGRFRNFLSYERRWMETAGSEDSHGRTLWALGTVAGRSRDPGWRGLAEALLCAALPAVEGFTSPRAWAYTLLGIDAWLPADNSYALSLRDLLAQRLLRRFQDNGSAEWPWLEQHLTYANARLPQALMVTGRRLKDEAMVGVGTQALAWLAQVQRSPEGWFAPVGSEGFYPRGDAPAVYDQQPIEACGMVSACRTAYQETGAVWWLHEMRRAFGWFMGQNTLQTPLYDPATGGCCDGIHPDRLNRNQGAESTLSFLQALLDLQAVERAPGGQKIDLHLDTSRIVKRA